MLSYSELEGIKRTLRDFPLEQMQKLIELVEEQTERIFLYEKEGTSSTKELNALKAWAVRKRDKYAFSIEDNVPGDSYVSQCNRRKEQLMEPYEDFIEEIDKVALIQKKP